MKKHNKTLVWKYMLEALEEHRDSITDEVNSSTLAEDALTHFDIDPDDMVRNDKYYEWAVDVVRADEFQRGKRGLPSSIGGIINRYSSDYF